jgi:L-iditol 2-dehydrogenase
MVAPGKIVFNEVEKPVPHEGEVLIQVRRIGICGSDIHVFHGMHPYTSYPVVQGHEVSGFISEVGEGVEGFSVGDKVTFMPQITCGRCYPCQHGQYHICDSLKVMGFQSGGAAQEYFAIEAQKVLKLPEEMAIEHAAMIEPIAVAVHALSRGEVIQGKKVIVLGAGTIGNLVGQVAKACGTSAVLITDVREFKLEKAKQCGLDFAVNPQIEDLDVAILDSFGADRADLILECVGVEETIDQAIRYARKGSTIVVVGVFGEKARTDLGLVQDRELNLVGTLMYQKVDYEKAIELVSGGKMHLDELISARYPFRSYMDAYQAIEEAQGNILKVMIELD